MVRYVDEAQALADGFVIEHEADRNRFVILRAGELTGEAHYTLIGDDMIDFDHTVVSPDLRGTGLSGLLAQHALTDQIVHGRRILASCWFIEGYLAKHPQLARGGA